MSDLSDQPPFDVPVLRAYLTDPETRRRMDAERAQVQARIQVELDVARARALRDRRARRGVSDDDATTDFINRTLGTANVDG